METKEVIDRIFKEPGVKYQLTEFEGLNKPIHQILNIYAKTVSHGKDAGKTKYFLKSFVPFSSGNEEVQVYVEGGKSSPEEIVRQLWVYKLIHQYDYKPEEIDLEKSVHFGTEVGTKAADIIIYTDSTKTTPKIIVECKKPKRTDGLEQLKSYMNAKGAPVAIWSNGADSIILYRPYPAQFDDTLFDLPKRGELPKDVLEARKTVDQLRKEFNFKKILQDLEELVLADSGKDEFNEIFKIIFAKIWDEKQAAENRPDRVVEFRKSLNEDTTFTRINSLFKSASAEWPGIFKPEEEIELAKRHLQVCVGPIEGVRLMGSNLRIMDDAFEYLLPTEAKKKKGQFFTPRNVIEMCVRMLNPTSKEYVLDPSCGSGGFLLHTMDWCYPAVNNDQRELRKHRYAAKYLWGIDFEARAAKTSRALMLIAGDGHTNIFGPDVSSLDPKTWYETGSGQALMKGLRVAQLTKKSIPENEPLTDDDKAWEYFNELKFDVILANPPFAGEMKDKKMLAHYELAKNALKRAGDDKQPKEERDVLFIERIVKMLKPGGRSAIVLPQGKFNNSSLSFIREWVFKKARILGVVGLHVNSFKPHTGTKTSVLLLQRYTPSELADIEKIEGEVAVSCPDYQDEVSRLLKKYGEDEDSLESNIPGIVLELLDELFGEVESDYTEPDDLPAEDQDQGEEVVLSLEERISQIEDKLNSSREDLANAHRKIKTHAEKISAKEVEQKNVIESVKASWNGSKSDLNQEVKSIKAMQKVELANLKLAGKEDLRILKLEARGFEKQIPKLERALKGMTLKGRLELLLDDPDLILSLRERWISTEIAKRQDYPIFMAVSERSGKNNSGGYDYLVGEDGVLVEFPEGHPQEGQLVINQDLVNFNLSKSDLDLVEALPDDSLCITEAFIKFSKEQKFSFWSNP